MEGSNLIGYLPKKTVIHQLSGFTKLLCFLLISVVGMISYDTRFLLGFVVKMKINPGGIVTKYLISKLNS